MAQLQSASKSVSPPLRGNSLPSLGDIFPGSAECEPPAATARYMQSPFQESSRGNDTDTLGNTTISFVGLQGDVPSLVPRIRASRRTKAHIAKACQNCRKAHLSCDEARPCARCFAAGKQVGQIFIIHTNFMFCC